ncbi:hypothetical protein KBC75_03790 [Candidatus Shapirobacteria bacterium]|nr:hypothetical protein [Candidatus Shapirobacteria bacterium]
MKTMMGNKGLAQLWILIGLVVMAVALPVASVLVSKNQDNRNKAAGNSVCYPSNGTTVCYYPTDVPASPTKVPTPVPTTMLACCKKENLTKCPLATANSLYGSTNWTYWTKVATAGDCSATGYGVCDITTGSKCVDNPPPVVGGGGGGSAGGGVAPTSVVQATPTNASCFLPGTLISTSNGTKRIEEVREGDVVLSFDNQNKVNSSVVSNLMNFSRDYYYRLVAGDSEVKVTAEHPFYRGNGEFTQVKDLQVGDEVYLLKDGEMVKEMVSELQRVDEKTPVYNLTVETDHTYFANGFAVHNKNVAIPPQAISCKSGDTSAKMCAKKYGSKAVPYDVCPSDYTRQWIKGDGHTYVTKSYAGFKIGDCIAQQCCLPPPDSSEKLFACSSAKLTLKATVKGTQVTINGRIYRMSGTTMTAPVSGYGCHIPTDQTCVEDRADYAKDSMNNVVKVTSSSCKIRGESGNCCPPGKF